MAEPVVEQLAEEWACVEALCADFSEADWATPTALPGWSVKDNLSHLVGTERMLMGDPAPAVDLSHLTHLTSPFAEGMEMWVEARRANTGAEVLAEFHEQVPRRLAALRAMSDEEMATPGWSPLGEVPYRDFMGVRLFDSWMHEQDMRRALDRPGHVDGPVVDAALGRFRAAVPFVVGKKAAAPDGASVVFALDGGPGGGSTWPIVVDGRARLVDDVPEEPTTRISLPFTTFVALGGGRWDADEAAAAGGVHVEGDRELGARVLGAMAFTP